MSSVLTSSYLCFTLLYRYRYFPFTSSMCSVTSPHRYSPSLRLRFYAVSCPFEFYIRIKFIFIIYYLFSVYYDAVAVSVTFINLPAVYSSYSICSLITGVSVYISIFIKCLFTCIFCVYTICCRLSHRTFRISVYDYRNSARQIPIGNYYRR